MKVRGINAFIVDCMSGLQSYLTLLQEDLKDEKEGCCSMGKVQYKHHTCCKCSNVLTPAIKQIGEYELKNHQQEDELRNQLFLVEMKGTNI